MLLLPAETLPEGAGWAYELKLDGYRALAIKTGGTVRLRSRDDRDFNRKYPTIALALVALPDETVIDREWSRWTKLGFRHLTRFKTAWQAQRSSTTCSTSWSWAGVM